MPGGATGAVLGPICGAGQSQSGVDADVAEGLRLPSPRAVIHPWERGEVRGAAEDEVAQRSAGQVRGGESVAYITASPGHLRRVVEPD